MTLCAIRLYVQSGSSVKICSCRIFNGENWSRSNSVPLILRQNLAAILANKTIEILLKSMASEFVLQGLIKDLPDPVWLHCIIQLNETFLLSIGGYNGASYISASNFYNLETEIWIPGIRFLKKIILLKWFLLKKQPSFLCIGNLSGKPATSVTRCWNEK